MGKGMNGNSYEFFKYRIGMLPYINPEGGLLNADQDKRSKRMKNYLNQIQEIAAITNSPVAYFMEPSGKPEAYMLAGMFRHIELIGISNEQVDPKYSEKKNDKDKSRLSFMTTEEFEKGNLEWSVAIYNRMDSKKLSMSRIDGILEKLHPDKGMFIGIYGADNGSGVITTFFLNGTRNRTHYSETTLFETPEEHIKHLKK